MSVTQAPYQIKSSIWSLFWRNKCLTYVKLTTELTDSLSDSTDLTLLSLDVVSLRVDAPDHWESLIIDRYPRAIYIMIVTCVACLSPECVPRQPPYSS